MTSSIKLILRLLLLSLAGQAGAGWVVNRVPEDSHWSPGRAYISYADDPDIGVSAFDDALIPLRQSGHLQRLELIMLGSHLRDNAVFQNELMVALEQIAPTGLREAQRSAGNMHNQKMLLLSKSFDHAVLNTVTVKAIDRLLAQDGLSVIRASHEKLTLAGPANRKRFDCMLFLIVAPE
jgi:hypothetical protein